MKYLCLLLIVVLAAGCTPATRTNSSINRIRDGLAPALFVHQNISRLKNKLSGPEGFEHYLKRLGPGLKKEPGAILTTKPVEGRLSAGFGSRRLKFERRARHHSGLDLAAPKGTEVRAAGGGQVVAAGWRGAYGRAVEIDHGQGLHTLYGHLDKYTVRPGQTVAAGQALGQVGNTGRSTGPHLHFEMRLNNLPVNPAQFLPWAEAGQAKVS